MKKLVLLAALLMPAISLAEVVPPKGMADARVRVVDYNSMNVVRLITFYGVSTHVEFGADEQIEDVALGDAQAWQAVPRGRHLFIKPAAEKADTNLTVVTSKRVYQFALTVRKKNLNDPEAWKDPNIIFSLSFRYPSEELEKRIAQEQNEERKRKKAADKKTIRDSFASAPKAIGEENVDYWVAGSDEVSPVAAKDNGQFMYLTFATGQSIPAVYSVDDFGNEALIPKHVEDNVFIVHKVYRKLIIRRGNYIACIVNKAYSSFGGNKTHTGTISPKVERVLKGADNDN
ncbi:P-type conjugative transfer protein VirB9 [Pseudomonas sp. DCB_CB]|uniref:P-type conjugative transfer protein VirB9 n=1 Tax=unclassified Pseudomonas TaxID=196821 RepID=UPI0022487FEC|nr:MULTISPECIES: P-type conjugative transfer protein VirB9 [unclassified Pseudomonas]MCX2694500.1 P-type conjugative transfer protein VirB9 [Pseudomonas sp. DCB_BZ]MCX2859670.1 P-type conjugative transfer protein VirB9 [Pseudomonas sp. DCB_CB]